MAYRTCDVQRGTHYHAVRTRARSVDFLALAHADRSAQRRELAIQNLRPERLLHVRRTGNRVVHAVAASGVKHELEARNGHFDHAFRNVVAVERALWAFLLC